MFSTFKQRLLLGIYIFIIISIPMGAYLASQTQIFKSRASEPKKTSLTTKAPPLSGTSGAQSLLDNAQSDIANLQSKKPTPTPSPAPSSPEIAASFGPTLSLKVTLEGRPASNQATKLFVGILERAITSNPKFLLSFSVDLPVSGEYTNLSLAGLNPGTQYTALLKGSAQIAASSAFIMSPNVTYLNSRQAINMLTGDLNEDNVINSADYSIIQKSYGTTQQSANWNENTDFNKDGIVNSFDLAILSKNLGQTGSSGAWTSPIPKAASPSASLTSKGPARSADGSPVDSPEGSDSFEVDGVPTGSPAGSSGGYWVWIPK